jgi:hypothetical protein
MFGEVRVCDCSLSYGAAKTETTTLSEKHCDHAEYFRLHFHNHGSNVGTRKANMKKIYLLGLLPPSLNVVGAVLSTRPHDVILGIPAMLFWVVGCVVVTSIVMRFIYILDKLVKPPPESIVAY